MSLPAAAPDRLDPAGVVVDPSPSSRATAWARGTPVADAAPADARADWAGNRLEWAAYGTEADGGWMIVRWPAGSGYPAGLGATHWTIVRALRAYRRTSQGDSGGSDGGASGELSRHDWRNVLQQAALQANLEELGLSTQEIRAALAAL